MTQWGLDTLFNPAKRHMDDEKRRLQSTREQLSDSSGGKRIDLESGKVTIRRGPTDADTDDDAGADTDATADASPPAEAGTATEPKTATKPQAGHRDSSAASRRAALRRAAQKPSSPEAEQP